MAVLHQKSVGDVTIYEVDATPTHSATKGSVAFNASDSSAYRNYDGSTGWRQLSSTMQLVGAQPDTTYDVDAGYQVGDMALYPTLGLFVCADNTASAAAWALFSPIQSASSAPTVNDDQTKGFNVGQLWMDSSANGTVWFLQDKSTGAAVWIPLFDPEGTNDFVANGSFRATYDFATHGGTTGSNPFGIELPDNAYILDAWYEVQTTFQSTTGPDNATVGLGVVSDDATGLVASIAINDVSNPWDSGAGPVATLADRTVANFTAHTTARRRLNLEVGVEAITAGRLIVVGTYATTE